MHRRITLTITVLAAMSLLAACGGSSPPANAGSTSGTNPSFKQLSTDAYKHSACMRSHGVPNFPDPHVVNKPGQQIIGISAQGLDTNSPAFKAAQQACAHLMPGSSGPNHQVGPSPAEQQRHKQALIALARCIRGKGFPHFPDPNSQGNLPPQMLTQAGINIHQPAFAAAAESCASVTNGVITVADIKRALAGGPTHTQSAAGQSSSGSSGG